MKTVKVRKIGNSLGVILPKELLSSIQAGEGEELSVSVTGTKIELSVARDELEEELRLGREIAHEYSETLRDLAK